MEEFGIHVELPVQWSEPFRELGALQALRCICKPIIAGASTPGYGLCKVIGLGAQCVEFGLLSDAIWSNGKRVTADEIRESIVAGLKQRTGTCRLLGISSNDILTDGSDRIIIRSIRPDLVVHLLKDVSFAPRKTVKPNALTTGAYSLQQDGILVSNNRPINRLKHVSIRNWRDTLQAYDRGDIIMTAPTAYDVSVHCSDHPHYRACNPEVDAFFMFNPRRNRMHTLSIPLVRSAILEKISTSRSLRTIVEGGVASPLKKSSTMPQLNAEIMCLYADYWPNAAVVAEFAEAFQALGVKVNSCSVSLNEFIRRIDRNDFDTALFLIPGSCNSEWSLSITLGSIATMINSEELWHVISSAMKSAVEPHYDSKPTDDLLNAIWKIVPAVPIGRFTSGFLADPKIPFASLLNGGIFPLEMLSFRNRLANF